MSVYCRVLHVDMGQVYTSEWLRGLWRTKGSDLASSQSILSIRNSSKASSETPRPLQAWCHSVILGATHLSAPLNTHYTFYNLPRPLSVQFHAYNNPQQLLVFTKHYYHIGLGCG